MKENSNAKVYTIRQKCPSCDDEVFLRMSVSEYEAFRQFWKYDRFSDEPRMIPGLNMTKSLFLLTNACPRCQKKYFECEFASDDDFIYMSDCDEDVMDKFESEHSSCNEKDLIMALSIFGMSNEEKIVYLAEHDLEEKYYCKNGVIFERHEEETVNQEAVMTIMSGFCVTDEEKYHQLLSNLRSTAEITFTDWNDADWNRIHGFRARGQIDYIDIPDFECFCLEHKEKVKNIYLVPTDLSDPIIDFTGHAFEPISNWPNWPGEYLKNKKEYRVIDYTVNGDFCDVWIVDMAKNPYGSMLAFFMRLSKILQEDVIARMLIKTKNAEGAAAPFHVNEIMMCREDITIKDYKKREIFMHEPELQDQNEETRYGESNRFYVEDESKYWSLIAKFQMTAMMRNSVWQGPNGKLYHKLSLDGKPDYKMALSAVDTLTDVLKAVQGNLNTIIKFNVPSFHTFSRKPGKKPSAPEKEIESIYGWKSDDTCAASENHIVCATEYKDNEVCFYLVERSKNHSGNMMAFYVGLQNILDTVQKFHLECNDGKCRKDINIDMDEISVTTEIQNVS